MLRNKSTDEWFFSLTYYLIYYPLFWYLEHTSQTYTLHASALDVNQQGIVICGLENVGKTSLALKFMKEQQAALLSDNLIFFDEQNIYPCYELIRVKKNDDHRLWEGRFTKVDQFNIPKDLYQPTFHLHEKGIHPEIMLFPEFGQTFFFKQISSREAANRAAVLSFLPSELDNYAAYRHLYQLLDFQSNSWPRFYETLFTLLAHTPCYRVQMVKREGLDRNFEKIKEALSHVVH